VERGDEGSIREAVAFAWRDRRLRVMLLGVTALAVAVSPVVTLAPTLARDVFGARPVDAGLLISAYGAGAIVGAILLTRAFRSQERARFELLVPSALALAGGLVACTFGSSMAVGMGFLAVAGLGFITSSLTWTTGIQQAVPEELRGRVMGLWTLAFLGVWPLVAPFAGALSDAAGPRVAVAAMVIPMLVVAAVGVPIVRRSAADH